MAQLFLPAGHKSSGKTTIAIGRAAALSGAMPEETGRAEAPWFESFVDFVCERRRRPTPSRDVAEMGLLERRAHRRVPG
jgi:hypothetical protein